MGQSSLGMKHETQKTVNWYKVEAHPCWILMLAIQYISRYFLYARQAILLPAILSFASHARTARKLVALPRPCVLTKIKNTFTVLIPKTSHARVHHAGPNSPDRVIML